MKRAETKPKINERPCGKRVNRIVLIALCVAVALVILGLASLLFSVKEFEIEGDTHYEVGELIDISGIRKGNRLYWLNKGKAEKRLLEGCPYLKSVKIKSKFPNTICFSVEERIPGWYVQIGEDMYALDYDLKVLLETAREDTLTERGLTRLVLPQLKSAVIGEYPGFALEDEHLRSETLKIIDSIRTNEIKERLTYLDLSNRFEITMTVDGSYTVNFGDMDNAQTKFDMIDEIIATSKTKGYAGGEINVINPSAHSFKGYYPDDTEGDN